MSSLIDRFRAAVMRTEPAGYLDAELMISESSGLATYYAPFEHVNTQARVVLVGITPGMYQAQRALEQLRSGLREGLCDADALRKSKEVASFSGPMRKTLVEMLDFIGLHTSLNLRSCSELFGAAAELVHFTSVLRNPVFSGGKNYTGSPSVLSTPYLRNMTDQWLTEEVHQLSAALWIPLGKEPTAVLRSFSARDLIGADRLLDGLPHPSGANAERIAYFLGRKRREHLSTKTNAETIDAARIELTRKIKRYGHAKS